MNISPFGSAALSVHAAAAQGKRVPIKAQPKGLSRIPAEIAMPTEEIKKSRAKLWRQEMRCWALAMRGEAIVVNPRRSLSHILRCYRIALESRDKSLRILAGKDL